MEFELNEQEKEIIKTIVEYGDKVKYFAEIFNESGILEKKGIAIVNNTENGFKYIFLRNDLYDDEEEGIKFVSDLHNLIIKLVDENYIRLTRTEDNFLVIGRKKSKWKAPGIISIDNDDEGLETINMAGRNLFWLDRYNKISHSPESLPKNLIPIIEEMNSYITVNMKLKKFIKNKFKTETEINYKNEQKRQWIGIIIAITSSILGIVF